MWCALCPLDNPHAAIGSKTKKSRHKKKHHPKLAKGLQLPTTPIYVQYLFPGGYNTYNSPLPQVSYHPNKCTMVTMATGAPGDNLKAEVFSALLNALPPVKKPTMMPWSTGLSDTHAFLPVLGWAAAVQGLDINKLVWAAEFPGEEYPLYPLVYACSLLFLWYQSMIKAAHLAIWQRWMTDSKSQESFNPNLIGKVGIESYTQRMVRLFASVLCVADNLWQKNAANSPLLCSMTVMEWVKCWWLVGQEVKIWDHVGLGISH